MEEESAKVRLVRNTCGRDQLVSDWKRIYIKNFYFFDNDCERKKIIDLHDPMRMAVTYVFNNNNMALSLKIGMFYDEVHFRIGRTICLAIIERVHERMTKSWEN